MVLLEDVPAVVERDHAGLLQLAQLIADLVERIVAEAEANEGCGQWFDVSRQELYDSLAECFRHRLVQSVGIGNRTNMIGHSCYCLPLAKGANGICFARRG